MDHEAEFLAFLDRASRLAPVANDPAVLRWNLSKRYLQELAAKGLPVIPSLFVDEPTPAAAAFDLFGADEIILKPVVGGGGFGQARVTRDQADGVFIPPGQFAQPLVGEIMTEGEVSMIFVDGEFSHAVRKLPGGGDYRIQVIHGGGDQPYDPSPTQIEAAHAFVAALPVPALACRVDVIPTPAGPLLMELEVIEPHLFPTYGPQLGERMAQACGRLLA
ncbi:ATP-grasp domain protein [soil metagenome]